MNGTGVVGDNGDRGVPHGVRPAVANARVRAERQSKHAGWQPGQLVVRLHPALHPMT
jgi:hypothetical protein